jgi:alkylhydroperoxidase/carboxymuconolactone decarboxylase family protein YurZ
MTDPAANRDQALAIRQKIMGDGWVTSVASTPGIESFTEQAIDHLWGGAWVDGTLELRLKSLITITALMSLGHLEELTAHVRGALREGLWTAEELRAVVRHASPYIGYPAGRHAMVVVDEIAGTIARNGAAG